MAMSAAAVSAFTLYDLGSPAIPPAIVATTGSSRRPARPRAEAAFTFRISPTSPRSLAASSPARPGRAARPTGGRRPGRRAQGLAAGSLDEADELLVDLAREDHLHDFHRLLVGISQAVDEDRLLAQAAQHRVYLGPAAVNEDRPYADAGHEDEVLDDGRPQRLVHHGRAAVLDDDGLALVALNVGQRLGEYRRLVVRVDFQAAPFMSCSRR